MKVIIAAALLSLSSFAVENCKDVIDKSPYKGKVTKESDIMSYGGCPDNLLVNDRFVVRLSQVLNSGGKQECFYSSKNIAFVCEPN